MDNPNDRFGAATYVRRDCAYTLPGMAKKRTMVARRAVLIAAPLAGLFALGGRGFGQAVVEPLARGDVEFTLHGHDRAGAVRLHREA